MKVNTVCILCLLIVLFGVTAANAAEDGWNSWEWYCSVGHNTGDGFGCYSIGHYGVRPENTDGYDTEGPDRLIEVSDSLAYVGAYHKNGDDWTGPTGFYDYDIKAPVSLEPGSSKSWLVNVWADENLDPDVQFMVFGACIVLPVRDYDFTITLLKKPDGIQDGPLGGTVWDLSNCIAPYSASVQLPAYRTDNGLDGYLFELKATAVPEPSSLLAFLGGLSGIGGIAWWRRR